MQNAWQSPTAPMVFPVAQLKSGPRIPFTFQVGLAKFARA